MLEPKAARLKLSFYPLESGQRRWGGLVLMYKHDLDRQVSCLAQLLQMLLRVDEIQVGVELLFERLEMEARLLPAKMVRYE
jgi:hypothetical protein